MSGISAVSADIGSCVSLTFAMQGRKVALKLIDAGPAAHRRWDLHSREERPLCMIKMFNVCMIDATITSDQHITVC